MSTKNSNLISIITGLVVIVMIGAGILLHEEPDYTAPNTLETNIVWLDLQKTKMDLWIRCDVPVYGIQFEFEGVKINKAHGGYLELEDFNTSHNDKMILAFSFEGKSVPSGEYMMVSLDVSYLAGKNNVHMSNMVLAGEGGTALDFGYYDLSQNVITTRSTY